MATEVTQVVAEKLAEIRFCLFSGKTLVRETRVGRRSISPPENFKSVSQDMGMFPHWETASSDSPNTFIEPGQINPWQEVGVAGNPRVDLVVGEDHGVHLDVLDLVRVVADHTGKLHFSDFLQLEWEDL